MAYPQGFHYPPYPTPPRTNSTAIAALICGVVGLVTGLAGVVAIVLGHIARSQIRRTGEQGAGLALAGLILGYISVVLLVAAVVFYVWLVSVFVNV